MREVVGRVARIATAAVDIFIMTYYPVPIEWILAVLILDREDLG
jgi:phage gp36-like protein